MMHFVSSSINLLWALCLFLLPGSSNIIIVFLLDMSMSSLLPPISLLTLTNADLWFSSSWSLNENQSIFSFVVIDLLFCCLHSHRISEANIAAGVTSCKIFLLPFPPELVRVCFLPSIPSSYCRSQSHLQTCSQSEGPPAFLCLV